MPELRRNNPKFRCPICEQVAIAIVLEGRMDYRHGFYWRRHRCEVCGETYTTKQVLEPIDRPSPLSRLVHI